MSEGCRHRPEGIRVLGLSARTSLRERGMMGTGGPIRVVIADDHRLFREGLRLILSGEAGVEIVGEAATGLEAIEVVSNLKPDVVLLDITMPGMDGIEVIRPIRQTSPQTKPLMLTASREEAMIFKALKAGPRATSRRMRASPISSRRFRRSPRGSCGSSGSCLPDSLKGRPLPRSEGKTDTGSRRRY